LIGLCVVTIYISGLLASQPEAMRGILVSGLVMAVLLVESAGWDPIAMRRSLLIMLHTYNILGCLVAGLFFPEWTFETNYGASYLPGLQLRLHGLASHATSFALFLMLALLLEAELRFSYGAKLSRTMSVLGWITAIMILLTQAKVIIVIMAIILPIYAWRGGFRPTGKALVACAVVLTMSAGALILADTNTDVIDNVSTHLESKSSEASSLTGRTQVWDLALERWQESPLFGWGYPLWNLKNRESNAVRLGWPAPHAHSLYLQQLSVSGLVGLSALLVMLFSIFILFWHKCPNNRFFIVVCAVILLGRGVFEVSVRLENLSDPNNLFLIFCIAAMGSSTRSSSIQSPGNDWNSNEKRLGQRTTDLKNRKIS
jgi:O-antigen ligase